MYVDRVLGREKARACFNQKQEAWVLGTDEPITNLGNIWINVYAQQELAVPLQIQSSQQMTSKDPATSKASWFLTI